MGRVKLFVVKLPNASLIEADVIALCRAGMTGYKVPKILRFVDTLPKSRVGEILRRELQRALSHAATLPALNALAQAPDATSIAARLRP